MASAAAAPSSTGTTERYRAWKRDLVIATLAQAKIECEVFPLIDAHGDGRRRMTLHARKGTHDVLKVGFAAAHSHEVVPIDRCPILDPGLNGALEAAWALAEPLTGIGKPLDIQITATDGGLDVDVRGSGPLSAALVSALSSVAAKHRLARLTRHGELVLMRQPPGVTMGKARVILPPGSFLQATVAGEEKLGRAGDGTLPARQTHRRSVLRRRPVRAPARREIAHRRLMTATPAQSRACKRPSQRRPGLKPVKAETRDLFRRPLVAEELRDFDAVVFDPPRQGAQAQAERLAASKVPVVIAVSCNIATFARDARILIDGGYKIEGVTPVDQFRHTPHVELVARFTR